MLSNLFCSQCIQAASLGDFTLWIGLALGATVICLVGSHKNFKRSRLIADMPTSKVRSASQGYTELVGIAKHKGTVIPAPLTARECLWWHYKIERYQSSGKSSHWVTLEKGTSKTPFYLLDCTGQCIIEPKGAEISSRHNGVWYGSTRKPIGQPKSYASSSFTLSISGIGFGRNYRYTEKLIIDGDPLYALGHFTTDQSGERVASISKISGDILRNWKLDFPTLLKKFDGNKDGELDIAEWQTVQHAAKVEAKLNQRTQMNAPYEHSLALPEYRGLPFIIGSHAQEKLTQNFRHKAIGFAVGFLLAGSLSTWLISARLIG